MIARLLEVDEQGRERLLGEHTFHHTRNDSRPARVTHARYGAGVRPWRRITPAIAVMLGGPPAAALARAANSRK